MADKENGNMLLHYSADLVERLGDYNRADWSLYDNLVAGSVKLSRKFFALQDNEDFFRDLTNEFLAVQQ